MKSSKANRLLIIILICFILALLSSCRKNTDGSDNSSIAESLITSANSSRQPVVVVPSPSSSRKNAEESTDSSSEVEASTITVNVTSREGEEVDTESDDVVSSDTTTSSSTASFSPSAEQSVTSSVTTEETAVTHVRVPAAPVFKSVTPTLVDDTIAAQIVVTEVFSYRGIESTLTAYADYATLTIPDGATYDDIAAAASLLLNAYPYLSVVTYSLSDGIVNLSYPEQNEDDIINYVSLLEKEAEGYIDTIYSSLEEKDEESYVNEEVNVHTFTLTEEKAEDEVKSVEDDKTEDVPEIVPATEKGKFIKAYSLSLSDSPYLESKYSSFSNIMNVDILLSFTERFSAGVRAGYDFKKYISLEALLKYSFTENIYLVSGTGYRFGLGENAQYNSFIIALSLGYELPLSDSIHLFGEAGLIVMPKAYSTLNPSLTFGIRYIF